MKHYARHWLPLLIPALPAAPLAAQQGPVRHIPVGELQIGTPGAMVLRDSASWRRLWERYDGRFPDPAVNPRTALPPVDFSREMLIAVALGGYSACSSGVRYVSRAVDRGDSLVVSVVDPLAKSRGGITCMMFVRPVDVARVPRSARPVAFHFARPGRVAPPANWLDFPDSAALDRLPKGERNVMLEALARDRDSPLPLLRAVARRALGGDPWTIGWLLWHPAVRDDAMTLRMISDAPGTGGVADSLLIARFGSALAADTTISPRLLERLLATLPDTTRGMSRTVASHLLENPRLRADRQRLATFVRLVLQYHPGLSARACAAYLSRYPAWNRYPDQVGDPGLMERAVPCPGMPPDPRPLACRSADTRTAALIMELRNRVRFRSSSLPQLAPPDSGLDARPLGPGEVLLVSDESLCRRAVRALVAAGDTTDAARRAARSDSGAPRVILVGVRGLYAVEFPGATSPTGRSTILLFDWQWRPLRQLQWSYVEPAAPR